MRAAQRFFGSTRTLRPLKLGCVDGGADCQSSPLTFYRIFVFIWRSRSPAAITKNRQRAIAALLATFVCCAQLVAAAIFEPKIEDVEAHDARAIGVFEHATAAVCGQRGAVFEPHERGGRSRVDARVETNFAADANARVAQRNFEAWRDVFLPTFGGVWRTILACYVKNCITNLLNRPSLSLRQAFLRCSLMAF